MIWPLGLYSSEGKCINKYHMQNNFCNTLSNAVTTDRLGYYLVGWKKFYNKTLALMESKTTGYEVQWVFNDKVYSSIDWSIPIETPLLELYKKRALQLREQYDYLILYYSGGADSTMALHAFIDNGILIDELIMHFPEPVKSTLNDKDFSNLNYYSEVEYAATAHLKKVKNTLDPRTKITYQDFSKTGIEVLKKEDWIETSPLNVSISISGILRQITQEHDAYNLRLQDSKKSICYLLGVDKPLVYFDGTAYFCYFMDTSAYHYVNPVDFNKADDNCFTEFFYWTPDMPEIVVKQAQEIKKLCESNAWAKFMVSQSLQRHISEYRPILHPVIYPDYVCEQFQTEKPSTHILRPMDKWFWETAPKNITGSYLKVIDYLKQHTNAKHMIKNNIQFGLAAHKTKFYKL
jgi:hypothetical protein